jgi:hypothetical protein
VKSFQNIYNYTSFAADQNTQPLLTLSPPAIDYRDGEKITQTRGIGVKDINYSLIIPEIVLSPHPSSG